MQLTRQQISESAARTAKTHAETSLVGTPTATERKALQEQQQAKNTSAQAARETLEQARALQQMVTSRKGTSVLGGSRVFTLGVETPGTSRATFGASFRQLKDSLAATNLDRLKGAMSDKDIEFLRNIGTKLDLSLPESAFYSELEKIVTRMDEKLTNVTLSDDERSIIYDTPTPSSADPSLYFNNQ